MDIREIVKDKIEEIVKRVKEDSSFAEKFKKDPVKAAESVLGVDLPDEAIEKIVEGVKAKIMLDDVSGVLGGLKKLF